MVALPSWRPVGGALAVAMVLAGCGGGDDDGLEPPPPSCLPDCPGSRAYDADAYHLRARFDADALTLHASADLTLAAVGEPIVELDAEVEILDVFAGNQRLAHVHDGTTLRVDVGPVLTDGAASFTVDYRATTSDTLVYTGPRDDDPVLTRVVYTDSEPDRGRRWLVAKHDPSDRARFSVELTVAAGDDAISNGARVRDDVVDGERVVGYALAQPIPTYTMAFAAGPLEHAERATGPVPLQLWWRRGLLLDPAHTFDLLDAQMAFFEERLGPYPWESYAVVLLPRFGGGMENTTITFNDEATSQGVLHVNLNAHELAHQWFGDHVTMRSYDDIWTKEGMATFLAAEAELPARDDEERGRHFGGDFLWLTSSAIVDTSLAPRQRYTDGPYGRAAWLITQIRRVVGEEAFWSTLRRVLAERALADVNSEDFVRSFAPALDEATIQRVLASLPARVGAELSLTATPVAGALEVGMTVSDPAGVLIAPIEVTVVDAAGESTPHAIGATLPMTTFTIPAGGYAAPDEDAVHPSWARAFEAAGVALGRLLERTAPPPGTAAYDAYLSRSAAHQERAIFGALAVPDGASYRVVYDALDSTVAQEALLVWTCAQFANQPGQAALAAALEPLLKAPPLTRYNTGLMRCPVDLARRAFGAELDAALAAPTAANAARLEYLISFDHGTAENFLRLSRLATTAPSLELRDRALTRMVAETQAGAPRPVPEADRPAWRAFFRDRYASVTSTTRLFLLFQATFNLRDLEALPLIGPLLHTVPMSEAAQRQLVCEVHRLTGGDAAAWSSFQESARPWDSLSAGAAAALMDPASCSVARQAPSVLRELANDAVPTCAARKGGHGH